MMGFAIGLMIVGGVGTLVQYALPYMTPLEWLVVGSVACLWGSYLLPENEAE